MDALTRVASAATVNRAQRPGARPTNAGNKQDWARFHRLLMEHSSDPCVWIDSKHGRIIDCNAAVRARLGYASDDLITMSVDRLAASLQQTAEIWAQIACGRLARPTLVQLLARSGEQLSAHASCFVQPETTRHTRRVLVVFADLHAVNCCRMPPSASDARSMAFDIAAIEARERQRIANGLHDEIGQLLSIISLRLGATTGADDELRALRDLVAEASRATRLATFELSCPLLQHLGLRSGIEGLIRRLNGLSGTRIELRGDTGEISLGEPLQSMVFRVIRELLVNALKHAGAKQVWVELRLRDGTLEVTVADNGCGMELSCLGAACTAAGGYGLNSALAQVQAIGGVLTLDSAPGAGLSARLTLATPGA